MNPLRSLAAVLRRLPDSPSAVAISEHFEGVPRKPNIPRKRVLLQAVAAPYNLGLFQAIGTILTETDDVEIELLASRSIEGDFGNSFRARVLRSFPYTYLISSQWERAYGALASRVGYRSVSWDRPFDDFGAYLMARKVWRNLKSIDELVALHYRGIEIGDLINDTYLRFRPAPRVDLTDGLLRAIIWQALRDTNRAIGYFDRRKPDLYIGSYSTYVQHGIAARVAIRAGVKVVTFGNLQEPGKVLTPDDHFHTRNPEHYREQFARLPDQAHLLSEAKTRLETRLSGGIDAATSYMRRSAYASTTADLPDLKGAVVLFLHDFYDSLHIYKGLLFNDFWTWADFTMSTLHAAGKRVLVKPHPNQVGDSAAVVDQLLALHPDATRLPSSVSNGQLAREGIACGVTMYGTIAHELAYLGVPVIAGGGNPHVAFDFCRTAKSVEEYGALLRRSSDLAFDDLEAVRRQVLEFYVMHNLALEPDQSQARDKVVALWKACLSETGDIKELLAQLDDLRRDPGMRRFVGELIGSPAQVAPAAVDAGA